MYYTKKTKESHLLETAQAQINALYFRCDSPEPCFLAQSCGPTDPRSVPLPAPGQTVHVFQQKRPFCWLSLIVSFSPPPFCWFSLTVLFSPQIVQSSPTPEHFPLHIYPWVLFPAVQQIVGIARTLYLLLPFLEDVFAAGKILV